MPFTDSINLVDVVIADKDLLSATPSDVAAGKIFIGSAQRLETGTIPVHPKNSDMQLLNGESFFVPYGINPGNFTITVQTLGDATISTAVDSELLEGKTAWVNGKKITGIMPNIGEESKEIAAGESHTISAGYHNGNGVITAKTLMSQTKGSIIPEDILEGSDCWANGDHVVGTMPNNKNFSRTLSAGETVTIPLGYHNGEGVVNAISLSDQTYGTAFAGAIAYGYVAWVNGERIVGTMPNNEPQDIVLPMNGEYVIPNGYHTGFGKVVQNVPIRPAMTIAPAKEPQILPVGGYYMEGDITVTGIDALNYQRLNTAALDSTGAEISNYTLTVENNSSTILISVDNWHDNATLNVYKIVSTDLIDAAGNSNPIDVIVMLDWTDQTEHIYKMGAITITTSLQAETNAQKIVINGITSGTISITEPFMARELNSKDDKPTPPEEIPPTDPDQQGGETGGEGTDPAPTDPPEPPPVENPVV